MHLARIQTLQRQWKILTVVRLPSRSCLYKELFLWCVCVPLKNKVVMAVRIKQLRNI